MDAPFDPISHPGNEGLFRALELSILSTLVGLPLHIHAEGLRGTGKTTIIRSVRRRLPKIQRLKGCVYNCLPWAPHCPEHRGLTREELRAIGTEWVPMPFREISHSAKVGTVGGSIDLARLADRSRPEPAILPGTIPQAHRGVIFVDEVNRLADTAPELADILLDVMGTKPGRLQIEETGLPCVEVPVSVSVWAASNPDEDPGPLEDIRKQLSDRFDFVVAMERPSTVGAVKEILRRTRERHTALAVPPAWACADLASGAAGGVLDAMGGVPDAIAVRDAPRTGAGFLLTAGAPAASDWLALGRAVRNVEFPPAVEDVVASLYIDFGLESLRAVEAIHHGARLNCVLEGRPAVTVADVAAVAPAALQHRVDVSSLARAVDFLSQKIKTSEVPDRPGPGADAAGPDRHPERSGLEALDGPAAASLSAPAGARAGAQAAPAPGSAADGLASGRQPLAVADSAQTPREARRPVGDTAAGGGPEGRSGADGLADPGPRGGAWTFLRSLLGKGAAGGRHGGDHCGRGYRGSGGAGPGRSDAADPWTPVGPGSPGQGVLPPGREPPVAPLHPARPLSEILKDMDLTGLGPQGPRPS